MNSTIMAKLMDYQPELSGIRRTIHSGPELGGEERRTAALVAGKLREWGVTVTEGVGGFGVVGTVKGKRAGRRSIGLRADMDALAIHEKTGAAYASLCDGKMHACGHDGHTAMLLCAARYLAGHSDFAGTVHFIFQPAEEGRGGAKAMLADGLFDRFYCDAIYGMHTMPGLDVGRFAVRAGPFFASACPWQVKFSGTGGHGASPHLASDATVVLGHFLLGLQTITSRNVSPTETAVISVGHVDCGSADSLSVIPATVLVGGTARCFSPDVGEVITRRISELAHTIAAAHGCTAEISIVWRAPPLINAEQQAQIAAVAASDVVGRDAVNAAAEPVAFGEDFAYMLQVRPGAFIMIGNGSAGQYSHGLHTPKFDFNDEIIPLGAAYWISLVGRELDFSLESGAARGGVSR